MLYQEMNLKQMSEFKPSEEDMAMLDLDVVVYIKLSIISNLKELNYAFIRFFFDQKENSEVFSFFKDVLKTTFYDFKYKDERFITIAELYAKENVHQCELLLKEILEKYTHEAEVIFDLYTHDDHAYRLSNLDGLVKYEEMKVGADK